MMIVEWYNESPIRICFVIGASNVFAEPEGGFLPSRKGALL